jgi:radical SAM superfamily enzyme YgiQ (UPF0313 family)
MSRIAIVKVRSKHDLEWNQSGGAKNLLKLLGKRELLHRLEQSQEIPFMPQLTIPYLSALGETYNKKRGTHHSFVSINQSEDKLDLTGYDVVWFTVSTSNALATYRVSDRLCAQGIQTAMGGIHVSVFPDEAAQHASTVVTGEAEDILDDMLSDLESGGTLKPRYQGGRMSSLDSLPVPLWNGYSPWVLPVQTSRGCRNACHFCSTTRFQGVARRHRPVEDVVTEIRTLREQGVLTDGTTVFFTDNNIVSDTDHRRGIRDVRYATELFKALVPLRISWCGQGEIGVADDRDLVRLMAESGAFLLLIGLETVEQENLLTLGKQSNNVSRYAEALDTLHSHGIANIGCFITGLDGDTPDVFENTRRFIDRWVDVPQLSILTPFPGTALFRKFKKKGRLLHEDWSKYDVTHVVFRPIGMTPKELEDGYFNLVRKVFTSRAIWKRALRYAFARKVNNGPGLSRIDKLTSILATNFIYRRLCLLGRAPEAQNPHRAHGGQNAIVSDKFIADWYRN